MARADSGLRSLKTGVVVYQVESYAARIRSMLVPILDYDP
jgi:hypothetical protein